MKKIIAMVLLLSFTAVAAWAQCSDTSKKELEAFDRAWGKAGLEGNSSELAKIYADDYSGLPGMVTKAGAIADAVAALEAEKARPSGETVTHDHYMIACTPSSAIITHRNTTWVPKGDSGNPETFYSRSVHILERRSGRWQVVSNAGGGALDDYSTLWYLEQDWNDAIANRTRAWFEANYASQMGSVSTTNARVMNRSESIVDDMDGGSKIDLAETSDMQIRVDGPTAIVNGVFRLKGKDEKGVAFDRRSRYTDTWIKKQGRWQVFATAGTIIP